MLTCPAGGEADDMPGTPPHPELEASALSSLLDRLDVGTFRIDHASGLVTHANAACARILGLSSPESMVGMRAADFYADPKERTEIDARLRASEAFRSTGVVRLELSRLRQDTREPIDVVIGVAATFDDQGRVVAMDCTLERVRDKTRTERAFRASEERFRTVFDKNSVGMALTDVSGHINRVNEALCRLLGRREEDLIGVDAVTLIHPDDRRERATPDTHPGGSPGRELRLLRHDGEVAWCYLGWSWVPGDDGTLHGAVVIVQDVTGRRQAEQRLQRLAKLESLGVLAGGIAHDFNNILAVILGNLSLAARLPDAGPRTREVLASAELASKRARELAQQLVTFARGGTPVKRTVSLAALVREAASFYLSGSQVAAELSLDPDLWLADVDPGQISQVLQNLFINAVQAMPDGGTVQVSADNVVLDDASDVPVPSGRYVLIRVADNGVGIPSANLERVFDPYFSTKEGGSGLGLATAHSIVRRHGGHLGVESTPGVGSTLSVYLPASTAAADATPPQPGVGTALPHARILVMDDEPAVRQVTRRILTACGLDVDDVASGEEAVAAFSDARAAGRPYAAVLLDLTVAGGMGGIEALERLRQLDPGVRAIVSTGYSADPVMADCRAYGFRAAVPKPFTSTELESVVRDVVAGEA